MKVKILGVIAAIFLVAVFIAALRIEFGSIGNAIAYFDGQGVTVDRVVQDLGTVDPDKVIDVTFNLVSLREQPLRIVGANSTCTCVLPPEIPMTLQPFVSTPLTFKFSTPEPSQRFQQAIHLYFDGPVSAVELSIRGVTR